MDFRRHLYFWPGKMEGVPPLSAQTGTPHSQFLNRSGPRGTGPRFLRGTPLIRSVGGTPSPDQVRDPRVNLKVRIFLMGYAQWSSAPDRQEITTPSIFPLLQRSSCAYGSSQRYPDSSSPVFRRTGTKTRMIGTPASQDRIPGIGSRIGTDVSTGTKTRGAAY